MKKIKEFNELILKTKNKRTAIIHDTDPDGLCSAVISCIALQRITGRKPLLLHQNPGEIALTEHSIELLKENFIEFVVTVDLSVDQKPEPIKEIEGFAEILVLDHHKTYNEINSEKTLMVKSQDLTGKEGSSYPVSKLAFDLFSGLTDLRDLDWIACIGLLGDNAYFEWKDFVDSGMKKYNQGTEIRKSTLFKVTQLIEAIETMDYSKLKDLIQVMLAAKKPEDVLKKDFLIELEELEKEVVFWEKKFEKEKKVFPEKQLVYFEIFPKHSVKSVLINRVSDKMKNMTVIIVQDFNEEHVYLSARRQDLKVKVNDLLEKSIKGIPDSFAGGHAPAAGGRIPKKYLNKFKKQLVESA
ncbi:MAG: DHHA1 domain-containing protein [archaeon]